MSDNKFVNAIAPSIHPSWSGKRGMECAQPMKREYNGMYGPAMRSQGDKQVGTVVSRLPFASNPAYGKKANAIAGGKSTMSWADEMDMEDNRENRNKVTMEWAPVSYDLKPVMYDQFAKPTRSRGDAQKDPLFLRGSVSRTHAGDADQRVPGGVYSFGSSTREECKPIN